MGKNKLEQYRNKFKEYGFRINIMLGGYINIDKPNEDFDLVDIHKEEDERNIYYYSQYIPIKLAKLIVEFAEDFMNGELD